MQEQRSAAVGRVEAERGAHRRCRAPVGTNTLRRKPDSSLPPYPACFRSIGRPDRVASVVDWKVDSAIDEVLVDRLLVLQPAPSTRD